MKTRFILAGAVFCAATACAPTDGGFRIIRDTGEFPLPPPPPPDPRGEPPNFTACDQGWFGSYYNLPNTHPDLEPVEPTLPGLDPQLVDWWDDRFVAHQKYDPSLEFGPNWWPVDEGLEADPAYFSVRWRGWVRAAGDQDVRLVLGATSDAWVVLGSEVVASIESQPEFTVLDVSVVIPSGTHPIEVLYTHRMGTPGFRFRVVEGDVTICFPDFPAPEDDAGALDGGC